jgi:hypothetical protein
MKLSKITNTQPEKHLIFAEIRTKPSRIEVRESPSSTETFTMKLLRLNETGRREIECCKLLDLQLPLMVRIAAVTGFIQTF